MPPLTVLGGEQGRAALEGVLALPKQTAGGHPAYPSVFDKASALLRSMILNHPFVDGNKRMAVASMLVFLYLNHEIVAATDAELVRLALGVATGRMRRLDAIAQWLRNRSLGRDDIDAAIRGDSLDTLVSGLPGRAGLPQRPLLDFVVFLILQYEG